MYFEVLGTITRPETIASGGKIREIARLRRVYGPWSLEEAEGFATVRLLDGTIMRAEVHWYEAHGLGRKEIKLKQLLGKE